MKYLSITVLLLFSSITVHADCTVQKGQEEVTGKLEINTDVPRHLRGATITITQADGKTSTVPAERFKVVPRKQQFITTKTEQTQVLTCNNGLEQKNRISVLGGYGAKPGLTTTSSGSTVNVESNAGFVGGVQYQRQTGVKVFGLPVSVGIQGQTNRTGLGILGLDFK